MQADGRLASLTREWDLPARAQMKRTNARSPVAQGGFVRVCATAVATMPPFDGAQVAHGKRLYASACAKCHGAALQGVTAPALTGPSFAPAGHSHLTLGGIFGYLSTNMPADRAGKMKPEDYTDIMAFLLYSNGYRPTSAKLTADVARTSTTPLNAGPSQ